MGSAQLDAVTALQQIANSMRGTGEIPIPLYACTLATGGTALAAWSDGSSATPGFAIIDSESWGIRWNPNGTPTAIACNVAVPHDLDPSYPITLMFDVSKVGATVGDATTLTVAAYVTKTGQLHDADANMGGATGAVVGNLATKTKTCLTRTISAADLTAQLGSAPLASSEVASLALSFGPTAGLLGTDDFCIHSAKALYTKRYPTV